ncbi:MAG: GNAT family N-acetyltransferase [Bacteroidota bacterium]
MNKEQLKAKIEIENIDLDISVGAFDNGKLVGFILHGFRRINGRNLVYNGGTGVLPEKRGNNLTIRMYNFILPFFHKLKIHSLQLEVISNNLYAINAYKKVGFSYLRACLKIFIF